MAFPLSLLSDTATAEADALDERNPQEVAEVTALVAECSATEPTAPPSLDEAMRTAYLALYDEAHENVLRMARSLVNAPEVAEDVAQETWMIMLRNWQRIYHRYDVNSRRGYLFLVTKTKALDVLRRKQRDLRRNVSLSSPHYAAQPERDTTGSLDWQSGTAREGYLSELGEHNDGDTLPERVAEAREEWLHLLAQCRNARERLMLTLRGAAFTHDEIAVLLAESGVANISTNAVKLALSRLLRRADLLGEEANGTPA